MVSGSDYSSSITNDWAEFKVPLSVMSSTTGVQLRIAVLFRRTTTNRGFRILCRMILRDVRIGVTGTLRSCLNILRTLCKVWAT